jgi:hypothetical protein
MHAIYFVLTASSILLAQGRSISAQEPSHFRYELAGVDSSMTTSPDGTAIPPNRMFIEVTGLPADARLYCNRTDLGQGRGVWILSQKPSVCDLLVVQSDGFTSYASHVLPLAGHRYLCKMRPVLRHDLVVTGLSCVQQDKFGFDLPWLEINSPPGPNRSGRVLKNVEIGAIATNGHRELNLRVPLDRPVTVDLWGDLIKADRLGTIAVSPKDATRQGVFTLDPHRRGTRYEISWRVEPDDTMADDLRNTFRDASNVALYTQTLRSRADAEDQRAKANGAAEQQATQNVVAATKVVTDANTIQNNVNAALQNVEAAKTNMNARGDEFNAALDKQDGKRRDLDTAWAKARFVPLVPSPASERYISRKSLTAKIKGGVSIDISPPTIDIRPPDFSGIGADASNFVKHGIDAVDSRLQEASNPIKLESMAVEDIKQLGATLVNEGKTLEEKAAGQALAAWLTASEDLERLGKPLLKAAIDNFVQLGKTLVNLQKQLIPPAVIAANAHIAAVGRQTAAWAHEQAEAAANWAAKLLNQLSQQDIIIYHIETDLNFSLNAYTGGYEATMDLGFAGLEWDTEKTKALFSGQLTLPDIDPLQLAAASFGLRATEEFDEKYDAAEKELTASPNHLYLASRRFVHWGGPQTAADLVAKTILDAGDQAIQEARQELTLEGDRLFTWASLRAEDDATRIACQLFTSALSALTGGGAELPALPEIKVKPRTIMATYRVAPSGMSLLPASAQKLVMDRFDDVVRSVSKGRVNGDSGEIPHLGFYVTWGARDETSDRADLNQLESRLFQGAQGSQSAFLQIVSYTLENLGRNVIGDELRNALSALTTQDLVDRQLSGAVLDKVRQSLNITADDIAQWYVPGEPVIHLEGTPIGRRFESLFGNVAIGNQGHVEWIELTFDLETMTFSGKLKAVHEHSWGTLASILKDL